MFTKPLGTVTLRSMLTVPFVVQIVVAVGLVGYLSFRNSQQAVNDVAAQLRREISHRIEQKLLDHVAIPHLINEINADAVRRGELQTQDRQSERYLSNQIHMLDAITWDYFGSHDNGAFIGTTRTEDGSVQLVINDPTTNFAGHYYSLDPNGNRQKLVKRVPESYDARQRPWYYAALDAGQPVWSGIYPDFALPQLVLSAVYPVYNQSGTPIGVVGVDFSLDDIGQFLQSLQVGKTGEAFIMERTGLLVASSADEKPYRIDDESQTAQRIQAYESSDPLIAATARYLSDTYNFNDFTSQVLLEFHFDDTRHFVQVAPFRDRYGLNWLIAVVIPETDFMAQINANARITLLLSALALFVALLAGIFTAHWVSAPILRLNAAARGIAEARYGAQVDIDRHDELGQLAHSFNNMSQQLQAAFNSLQASEKKYRSLFEDSHETIFISTPEGTLVDMNSAGLRLFGFTREDLPSINVQYLYFNARDRLHFRQEIERHGVVSNFEVRLVKGNGQPFDALITASVRYNERGEITGYQGIINDITIHKQNERLRAENLHLTAELDIARRIQQMILPDRSELEPIHALDIAGHMDPATEVGGDYYDVLLHPDGMVKIAIGDVTDHGLESGVIMLMAQTAVRTLLNTGETDPVRFLDTLNRTLYGNIRRIRTGQSLTLALLDYHQGEVRLSGRHEQVIVVRREGTVELVDTHDLGVPIGLDSQIADHVNHTRIRLQPGDGIVLYTNGLIKAENTAGQPYSLERLCLVAGQSWSAPAAAVSAAIIADVRQHMETRPTVDDMTLVVIKQRETSE